MPHVDGLRCVAVMSVLLFHFGVPGLSGGFVGVDVFFVISGYLITKIIVDEVVATGDFRFRNFYSRRIRRILPALIATLAVTTILAIVSLTPADLVAYGKSLVASAVSASNLLFWSESGYFDAVSKTKPLLHTWSLSVEEQFYLFWPALIYLSYRAFGKRGVVLGIVISGALSFVANHAAVTFGRADFKSDIFFLTHYRVFEFAIGAVGCFVIKKVPSSRRLHELMMATGLVLIAWSIYSLKEGMVFPYTNALLPCLGAFLVIASGSSRGAGWLLSNTATVWMGKISYSLYLVHWPVVVFVDQFMPATDWSTRFWVMMPVSFAAALALHHLVEVKFRYARQDTDQRRLAGRILGASLAFCAAGVMIFASNGMTWRYDFFTPGSFGGAPALAKQGESVGGSPAAERQPTAAEGFETVGVAYAAEGSAAVGADSGSGASSSVEGVASEQSNQPEQTGGDVGEKFRPLGAAEIDAGKGARFTDVMSACNIELLHDATRCFMGRPSQVLVFGNSHEPDAFNALNYIYGDDKRVNLINFGTVNDCELKLGDGAVSSSTQALACDKRFAILNSDEFIENIDVIFYNTHQGFDYIARDLWSVMEMIKKRNPSIKIVAIGSYLQTSMDCSSLYNKYMTYDACRSAEFVNYFNIDEVTNSPLPQVKSLDYVYISKYRLLCEGGELEKCAVFANGEPAFYDQHHLSRGFARYLGERIAKVHGSDLARVGLPIPDPGSGVH